MSSSTPVLVVGAGPTGLTLACQLLRRGVGCRVLDAAPEATTISKAVAVSSRSLEILDEIGVAEAVVATGIRLRSAAFFSRGRRLARVRTAALTDTPFPYTVSIPQRDTEGCLLRQLAALGGRVDRGSQVVDLEQDPAAVRASILHQDGHQETLAADWLVGADGAHSAVRDRLEIDFGDDTAGAAFAVLDARVDPGPPRDEAQYHYSADGLLVLVPLPGGLTRVAVTQPGGSTGVDPERMRSIIERRRPGRVSLYDAGWGSTFQVRERVAASLRRGRCLLAGDAAHIHSPVSGQGMNAGLQDAHNLGWKLALVLSGVGPESLLDSYEPERLPAIRAIVRAAAWQTRMGLLRSPPATVLRDGLMRASNRRGAFERRMAPMFAQLGTDYRDSPLTQRGSCRRHRRAATGRRIGDAPLRTATGLEIRLLAALSNAPLVLLLIGDDAPGTGALVSLLESRYGDSLKLRRVADRNAPLDPATWVDHEGALRRALGARGPCACLIRPDRHVAYVGPPVAEPLVGCLDRMLKRAGSVG